MPFGVNPLTAMLVVYRRPTQWKGRKVPRVEF
jgi:hypothetical protein